MYPLSIPSHWSREPDLDGYPSKPRHLSSLNSDLALLSGYIRSVKNHLCKEMQIWSMGWEESLKGMASTPVMLPWRIPWTESQADYNPMGSQSQENMSDGFASTCFTGPVDLGNWENMTEVFVGFIAMLLLKAAFCKPQDFLFSLIHQWLTSISLWAQINGNSSLTALPWRTVLHISPGIVAIQIATVNRTPPPVI